ncbi:MAG: class C sortase [Ruminococcus sp.]|nr:class C sortase [Ruminococcus sp.]
MKKHLLSIIIITMFIVGFSVLLYPSISSYINEKHASHVISSYNDQLSAVSDDKLEHFFTEAEDYNQRLCDTPSSFYIPDLVKGYDEALDITGTGIMGYIDIDKLNTELPIYHGVAQEVLQIGVGHLPGTTLPVGGDSTHCVLSGHRGLPSAKLFTDLNKMEIGDRFRITVLNRVLTYEVDQIKVVLPTETSDLQTVKGKDYCTLLTCTPYGINTHRLLVRGVRVEDGETVQKAGIFVKNEAFRIDPLIVMPITAIPLLIIALVLVFIHDRKSRSDK